MKVENINVAYYKKRCEELSRKYLSVKIHGDAKFHNQVGINNQVLESENKILRDKCPGISSEFTKDLGALYKDDTLDSSIRKFSSLKLNDMYATEVKFDTETDAFKVKVENRDKLLDGASELSVKQLAKNAVWYSKDFYALRAPVVDVAGNKPSFKSGTFFLLNQRQAHRGTSVYASDADVAVSKYGSIKPGVFYINNQEVKLNDGDTLAKVISAINDVADGFKASVVDDGNGNKSLFLQQNGIDKDNAYSIYDPDGIIKSEIRDMSEKIPVTLEFGDTLQDIVGKVNQHRDVSGVFASIISLPGNKYKMRLDFEHGIKPKIYGGTLQYSSSLTNGILNKTTVATVVPSNISTTLFSNVFSTADKHDPIKAKVELNRMKIETSTNVFKIDGLSFSLFEKTNGKSVKFSVSAFNSKFVEDFVDSYNELQEVISSVKEAMREDRDDLMYFDMHVVELQHAVGDSAYSLDDFGIGFNYRDSLLSFSVSRASKTLSKETAVDFNKFVSSVRQSLSFFREKIAEMSKRKISRLQDKQKRLDIEMSAYEYKVKEHSIAMHEINHELFRQKNQLLLRDALLDRLDTGKS